MYGYLTELMLNEYFTAEAVFGKYLTNAKNLFFSLSKIYLIPEKEAKKLYGETERAEVKDIVTEKDYLRLKRISQYLEMNDLRRGKGQDLYGLIDIKGNALINAVQAGIVCEFAPSEIAAGKQLTTKADGGSIAAMNILGLLLMEGVVFAQNEEEGFKNLERSAKWNSENGLMACIFYGERDRAAYIAQMCHNLEKSAHTEAAEEIKRAYGVREEKRPDTFRLLEKAFSDGILKPEVYNKQYARILFSDMLGLREKEGLFFSSNKDMFAAAANLPLKLSRVNNLTYDAEKISGDKLIKKGVRDKLLNGLGNSKFCFVSTYSPMCIASDSRFISERFANLLADSIKNAHIEHIEVADLTEYDFEPTKNNIFIRSCDEDYANVYFLYFRGEIPERLLEIVKNFLQAEKRARFRLTYPVVCLDLSPVLPICFCDRQNASNLARLCDVIDTGKLTRAEKSAVSEEIFLSKRSLYGADKLELSREAYSVLSAYSLDEAEKVLDTLVRDFRTSGQVAITEKELGSYIKRAGFSANNTYGFGGGANEGD